MLRYVCTCASCATRPFKANMQYLLTQKVSRYCPLALQSRALIGGTGKGQQTVDLCKPSAPTRTSPSDVQVLLLVSRHTHRITEYPDHPENARRSPNVGLTLTNINPTLCQCRVLSGTC